MKIHSALIIGSGHLADRVKKLLEKKGYPTTHIPIYASENINAFSRIFLLDDRDEQNLQSLIALISLKKDARITASLFNEDIAPHIRAAHPYVEILNPAKIAAPAFIEALRTPLTHLLTYTPATEIKTSISHASDNLIKILMASFALIIVLATIYFHFFNDLSWLDAIYFVVVTISTVGYGDITLLHASALSKIVDILLLLSSTFFIWTIFSLTVDRLIKRQARLALGRKKYSYTNHIILCGLGRLGYFIALELLAQNEKVIVIEKNEQSAYIDDIRSRGIPVYIGDARLPKVLDDVALTHAKALVSVVNNDYANIEIGLNARSIKPGLRLILRIFNEETARNIKDSLDIHLALSMSAIADEAFVDTLEHTNK